MEVKLKYLLWKNIRTEKHMWYSTFGEILAILVLCILVIAEESPLEEFKLTETEKKTLKIYAPDRLDNLKILRSYYTEDTIPNVLAAFPPNGYSNEITDLVAADFGLQSSNKYNPNKILATFLYSDIDNENRKVPENLTVKIRFPIRFRTFKSSRMHSNLWLSRCMGKLTTFREDSPHSLQTDLYIREGFLQFQHSIFLKWLDRLMPSNRPIITVSVRSFSYDLHDLLCTPTSTSNTMSVLYYFIYFLPFLNLLWKYGREVEENIIAHHIRYGCSMFKYWLSHFISSYLHFLLLDALVFILTIISWKTGKDPGKSDPLVVVYLFIVLLLCSCEIIFAAMIIVIIMRRAITAVYLGALMWLILYSLFTVVFEYTLHMKSAWVVFSLITLFNNDFVYSMRYLRRIEERISPIDIWCLLGWIIISVVMKLLILIIVQHYITYRYIDRRQMICAAKKNFDCEKKAKKKSKSKDQFKGQGKGQGQTKITNDWTKNYETLMTPAFGGLKIVNLNNVSKSVKTFRKTGRSILKKLNMKFFLGEITVILGHASSGKTTLASLLAGWQTPDEGNVKFYDKNIYCDMDIMHLADINMPNNALFDYLTPLETLVYFVNVKGHYKYRVKYDEEVLKWLEVIKQMLRPNEENHKLVQYMTYEQKRILALCCVLCCDTKIVILDEPTSHMMVHEQRIYWSILRNAQANRVIIVFSQFTREAEAIGDRIGILIDGNLAASGSSMHLKTKFGFMFNLVILKDENAPSEPITTFLQEFEPNIKPFSATNVQLIYKLPVTKRPLFQILLIQLQKRYSEFGIVDSKILTADVNEVAFSLTQNMNVQTIPEEPQPLSVDFLPKKKRVRQQWSAMFFKKFTHQQPLIIPVFMCCGTIFLATIISQLLTYIRDDTYLQTSFQLGFDPKQSRSMLHEFADCQLVAIKKIKIGHSNARDRTPSFLFQPDSFVCSNMPFVDYVDESETMDFMYGAVQKHGFDNAYTIFVNQHIFHSAPLALNLLHNLILENLFPDPADEKLVMRVINDPYPIPDPHATRFINSEVEHLYAPLTIGIIIPLTICTFIIPIVRDRTTDALMLMTIAGLRIDIYWLVNFIWDWLTFLAYSIIFQITVTIIYYKEIIFAHSFFIFLILNVYSIPLLASMYLTSMLFQTDGSRAYLSVCIFHVATGLFFFVFYWDVLLPQSWYMYIMMFFPTYAMLEGVSNMFVLSKYLKKCSRLCKQVAYCNEKTMCDAISECCEYSFFEWGNSGILRSLLFLLITTIIIVLLMFWVEIHQRESKFLVTPRIKQMYTRVTKYDDPDIARMRERIANLDLSQISKMRLVIDQVERTIPQNSTSLSTISFDVPRKQCVAVYGTGRVGKSHLCRQAIGQDSFRFGDIYVDGIPLKYNLHEAWVHLGYSPQRRSFLDRFAVIEILHFFCLIRGVPKGAIPTLVSDVSTLFALDKVMHRKLINLTKGQQRKVSIAVALMATNKIIVLDEPTTGLPTWNCREIWKALRYLCACGKSIMFTTRSMYECDTVSDAVLVMDEREMLRYGRPFDLRRKMVGFFVEARVRRDGLSLQEVEENFRTDVDNLKRFMIFMHSESVLVSQIDNVLKFYVPVENVNYGMLYGSIERNKARLNIIEYTVSQGNFEQILKKIEADRQQRNVSKLPDK